jgi:putative transposase
VVADHAHLLVALTGTQTLPSAMHQLKGASARFIFLKYPELKLDMGHDSFWQKGYGFRRLDPSEVSGVPRYIRTQGARPLRHN